MSEDDPRREHVRELQQMEQEFMRVVVAEPSWLAAHDEAALRWALSFARISAVPLGDGEVVEIGHATDEYRKRLGELLAPCFDGAKINREPVRTQIGKVRALVRDDRRKLLKLFGDRVPERALDRAVRKRPLALALGGGGGTAYVFLGAMAVLAEAGLEPALVTGTSMGSILGAFRCREREFSLGNVKQLLARLSWRRVFRFFETDSRFGLPATLKLHLREVIGHEFEREGRFMNLEDLEIPLRVCVAGLSGGQTAQEPDRYAHLLDDAVRNVGSLRRRAKGIAKALSEITKQPVKSVHLGGDELTRDFDVLDAIGFSSAVPGVIHYDVLRDDPRMIDKCAELIKREGVVRLVDGGLADNLPTREAWRAVQTGAIAERDPFVLGFDSFAPRLSARHLLFLPLMRIAAENTKAGRAAAHLTLTFKHVLSPLAVVPTQDEFLRAVELGRAAAEPIAPLVKKMVGPIPDPPGVLSEMDGS